MKINREAVKNKFNGLCAYTGKPLGEDWQVDHAIPKCHSIWHKSIEDRKQYGVEYDCDDVQNLLPAIKIVNHYKRGESIHSFKITMSTFHKRLARLPKKTSKDKTLKRIKYMRTIAELFDITESKPFSGLFYFETLLNT